MNPIPLQANTRTRTVDARADGTPITAGTVSYYLIANTGANAGKWFKTSDNSWDVAEQVAGTMAHKADGHWSVSVDAEAWPTAGVEYTEYAKESGDLHVPTSAMIRVETERASAEQVGNISAGSSGFSVNASGVTVTTGSETNSYTDTFSSGTIHIVSADGGTTLYEYDFDLSQYIGTATEFIWKGYIQANGDDVLIQYYNWATTSYITLETLEGSNGTTLEEIPFDVPVGATGTGANFGLVKMRFSSSSTTNIGTDRVRCVFNFLAGGIANGSTITLSETQTNKSFVGENWNLALGGQDISGSFFHGGNATGVSSASSEVTFENFMFGAATVPPGHYRNCGFGVDSGTLTAASAGQYTFDNCHSMVPGSGVPNFVFSGLGSTTGVNNRGWQGGANYTLDSNCTVSHEVVGGGDQTFTTGGADVELRGLCSSVTLVLSGAGTVEAIVTTGPVTISGTATTTVNLYGTTSEPPDDTSSGTTVNDYTVSNASINAECDSALSDWGKTGFTLTNFTDASAGKLDDILDGTGAVLTLSQLRVDSAAAGGAIDIDNSNGPAISSTGTTYGAYLSGQTAGAWMGGPFGNVAGLMIMAQGTAAGIEVTVGAAGSHAVSLTGGGAGGKDLYLGESGTIANVSGNVIQIGANLANDDYGANKVVPDVAGTASTLHTTTNSLINGISNVTRLSVAIPTYLERPPSGNRAVKVEVALKDTDGNMEDPDSNQLALTVANSGGTSRDTLLYKDFALTTPLDAGSGTFSAYKQLERSAVGLYEYYYSVAFDATEEELLHKFGWEESAVALYEFRATQVTDAANDFAVLLARCTELRLAELDPANLPAAIDLILEDTGTTLPALILDVPTVAEFNARTLIAASYFDPAADEVITDAPSRTASKATGFATPTNVTDAHTTTDAAIAALNDISSAQVNAEMVDALNVDTHAEPGSVPAATASVVTMVHWVYSLARNKGTQTATTKTLRNDADDGDIGTSAVSDDGTTFTRDEWT